MSTDMTVAHEIQRQIGGKAFFMMGAKHLGGTENSLSWKVGKNAAKVTHVTVTLNGLDLYDIEFISCDLKRKEDWRKVLSTSENVYVEDLHSTIERGIQMYLSLGSMGR